MATLYVGDLMPSVTETHLYDKFRSCGSIRSINLCREHHTGDSMGYAYVNYCSPKDAEKAMELLNYDLLEGKPMRIMWRQSDPSMRKKGIGNVFVKNLASSIDSKYLYYTFRPYGQIMSCTVAQSQKGVSKGFGFVHFSSEQEAEEAIRNVNGATLEGKKVYVGHFISQKERQNKKKYTNLYVKNFGTNFSKSQLYELFKPFGNITGYTIITDDEGHSKGFGFVTFEDPKAAEAAVLALYGAQVEGGHILYVAKAQKKEDRYKTLEAHHEEIKRKKHELTKDLNVYIKHLDDTVDDRRLQETFSQYGTIISAKVMTENNRSRGFGFVCYSKPEEARTAVGQTSRRKIFGPKPLYVSLALTKEELIQLKELRQYWSPVVIFAAPTPTDYYSPIDTEIYNDNFGAVHYTSTPIMQELSRYQSSSEINQRDWD